MLLRRFVGSFDEVLKLYQEQTFPFKSALYVSNFIAALVNLLTTFQRVSEHIKGELLHFQER